MLADLAAMAQQAAAHEFGVTVEDVRSKSRVQRVAEARMAAVAITLWGSGEGTEAVARAFGREHSGVSYSARRVHELMEIDPGFRAAFTRANLRMPASARVGMTPRDLAGVIVRMPAEDQAWVRGIIDVLCVPGSAFAQAVRNGRELIGYGPGGVIAPRRVP